MGADRRASAWVPQMPPSTSPPSLAVVQAIFYDFVTAPAGVASRLLERAREGDTLELEQLVRPSTTMSAVERVDVYANMYFYRILDVLRDEFPRTLAAVGDGAFHNLVTDYLLDRRPEHPSLREVGARLPEYVALHPLASSRPWLGELARLERAHLELFDGPDCPILTLERVRRLAPESLPELTLCAIPCHAVHQNLFRTSTAWTAAEADPVEVAAPVDTPEILLIWRQDFVVYHRVVDPDEGALLPLLRTPGCSFARVCDHLLATVDASRAPARAFELLGRWLLDGLLVAPTSGPPLASLE